DTAEGYAAGQSEIEMGNAIKQLGWKREDVVVSTKIFFGTRRGPNATGLSRKHLVEGTKASLERMGLDYVDMVFAHRPDDMVPMEETVRAFNHILDRGWAFYWGCSEWSAAQIVEAHKVAKELGMVGPAMEQPQYNMFVRERFEVEYKPLYENYGLGTTIWSPLASGILSGKYRLDSPPPEGSRLAMNDMQMQGIAKRTFETDEGRSRLAKVDLLRPVASALGCSMSQLALAWCAKNPRVSTVITGASRREQVVENFEAMQVLPKLTDRVMEEIEGILGNKPAGPMRLRL
ncbi:NADP-dependent oxidoreductase domain-containing protein, partial [Hyaloraphidium curvatum]